MSIKQKTIQQKSIKEQFISDLVLGQYYEQEYIKYKEFDNVHHPKEKCFKDYDFKNLDTEKSYEVKADRKTQKTGNLFIEFKSRDKPSGISTTKADYWVHFITCENGMQSKQYIKIKTNKLKKLIQKYEPEKRKGGDNFTSLGYIFPIGFLKPKYIHNHEINLNAQKKL